MSGDDADDGDADEREARGGRRGRGSEVSRRPGRAARPRDRDGEDTPVRAGRTRSEWAQDQADPENPHGEKSRRARNRRRYPDKPDAWTADDGDGDADE